MQRIEIHSRRGSLALGVVGVVEALCALATLLIYVVNSWGAASPIDRLLQLSLVASAAGGLYLLIVGLQNLGAPRLRRASAATSS
jgi:hypothetical protein